MAPVRYVHGSRSVYLLSKTTHMKSNTLRWLENGGYGYTTWAVIQEYFTDTGELGLYKPVHEDLISKEILILVVRAYDGTYMLNTYHNLALEMALRDFKVLVLFAGGTLNA